MHAEKLSFKKSVVAGERDRPDIAWRRAQWTKYQGRSAPERLVFVAETWTKTNMARSFSTPVRYAAWMILASMKRLS
jgi:hypothetical protein